jgi:hypothetical protein
VLISPEYAELNKKLHEDRPDYGISGARWASHILQFADEIIQSRDILDYGCGKRSLQDALGFDIRNYDPAIGEYSAVPHPADIVACTDVLEHIEPECLDDVLADLRRVTKKMGFFTIATRPAKKFLSDGRNAHLIQQDAKWWLEKLWDKFHIQQFNDLGGELLVIVS